MIHPGSCRATGSHAGLLVHCSMKASRAGPRDIYDALPFNERARRFSFSGRNIAMPDR
jgi:hypothetical protein